MSELVLYELQDGVCRIVLNRPQKHNCIDFQMLYQLDMKLSDAEGDSAVRAIVLCGAGDRAFSSGADLGAFGALIPAEVPAWIRLGNAVVKRLSSISKPTIAIIQGYAYGGGMELALACDFRIATPAARFCSPELKHGWIPGWGGLTRLRSLLGEARAKEIVFLSDVLDANDASRLGLVTKIVSSESIGDELHNFIDHLVGLDGVSFAAAKAMLAGAEVSNTEVEFQVAATLLAHPGQTS